MAERLYHEDKTGLRTRKVLDGHRATDDNTDCCCGDGGDDDVPDWVDPDGPGGPGGPGGPSNPSGTPRCCTGNTICSPNDTEEIEIGIRITGTLKNTYVYGSGPNAGNTYEYDVDFNEVFTDESSTSSCDIQENPSFTFTVPYVTRDGGGTPVNRDVGVSVSGCKWNRTRGFFGDSGDLGNDPALNIFSGIGIVLGTVGAPIRGTNNNGYNLELRICRSETPLLPATPRPDTYRWTQAPSTVLDSGTDSATEPGLACLNRVIYEYTNTFTPGGGGDTNSIEIVLRFYAVVRRVAVCEGI